MPIALRFAVVAAAALVGSCAEPTAAAQKSVASPGSAKAHCEYRVRAPAAEPFVLQVTAGCSNTGTRGFEPADTELESFLTKDAPRIASAARFEQSYRVDLGAMAVHFDRFDRAARFGTSLIAPASSFLLVPDPLVEAAPVSVHFDEAPGFATGLRRRATGYALESHEIRAATYTAFGARELRRLEVPGVALRLALLDGELDLGAERLARWVEARTRDVTAFYGQPPDDQLLVVVAPVAGLSGVRFGMLLPESAPGIVLFVGEHATEADLATDWMLVHELFHVGSPSFTGEGRWFDEGLATYFEPIIRARARLTNDEAVWREFALNMPQGLRALSELGLERGTSRADTYWGGALFCLLADVEIRRRTGGKRGLEDGMRAVLRAGGRSSEVWGLADTLRIADEGSGEPVLAELFGRYARRPGPLDLELFFRELGVLRRGEKVVLDDTAPLASTRRAIFGFQDREAEPGASLLGGTTRAVVHR